MNVRNFKNNSVGLDTGGSAIAPVSMSGTGVAKLEIRTPLDDVRDVFLKIKDGIQDLVANSKEALGIEKKQELRDAQGRRDADIKGEDTDVPGKAPDDRKSFLESLKNAFEGITDNALDSVSDRDFIIDFISNSSILMSHLSRFSEEIIIWCSTIYNFIELDDEVCTGSSIMPQKKNPDVLELIRGRTGTIYGQLINILTIMKAQPFAYNRDNQEDKKALFDCGDTLLNCLSAMSLSIDSIKLNKDVAKMASKKGYSTATDFADYLVNKKVPFRDAHEIVGKAVAFAIKKNLDLNEITLKDYKNFSKLIEEDIYKILTVEGSVNSKKTLGGTSHGEVIKQIKKAKKLVSTKRWKNFIK